MMNDNFGFYISELQVSGSNVVPAKLSFSKGFNVISGLSDTGKSYIFECINFMLGGGELPKQIPEGVGYSDILLEIKTFTNKTFTLARSIVGGDFKLKEVELKFFHTRGNAIVLKNRHTNNSENISSFLLGLCGFDDKYVRKNQNNAKRELSFRDIAKLTLIDEQRIITKKSPVYSGQYIEQTQEQSVLEIILTGKDAKELEQVEEEKIYKSRIRGKLEFIEVLINDLSGKLKLLESANSFEEQNILQNRLEALTIVIEESSLILEKLTTRKQELFNSINEYRSKEILHEELNTRFLLLREHYINDINRLEFILEGDEYFTQLNTINCPLCGGDMDKDHYDCIIDNDKKNSSVINSIGIETEKIKIKLVDLESTLQQLVVEKNERDLILNELVTDYKTIEQEILISIEPIKANTRLEIDNLINKLSTLKEQSIIKEQISNYYEQKGILEGEFAKRAQLGESSQGIQYSIFKLLCAIIEDILKKWKYPSVSNVNFDSNYRNYDIVINNKVRNAHGKGIRAITYTSFIIGIMDYCIQNNLPHSRNIIIDSPLTTYHGKETNSQEDISKDMQDAFFVDLANIGIDKQIIILDNKDPKEELKSKINYIHFTGDKNSGRQGFFPS